MNKNFYKKIFDNSRDALFIEDMSGNIIEVNKKACDILGYSKDELLKLNVDDLVLEEKYNISKNNLNKKNIFETKNIKKNGEVVPVEFRINIFKEENKSYLIVSLNDITERKKNFKKINKQKKLLDNIIGL